MLRVLYNIAPGFNASRGTPGVKLRPSQNLAAEIKNFFLGKETWHA